MIEFLFIFFITFGLCYFAYWYITRSVPSKKPKSKQAKRHAEKNRKATCEFANFIARLVITKFEEKRPKQSKFEQTVLAGFICENEDDFQVVAFGVGTKFLTPAEISADIEQVLHHDCHAEVLAWKGLNRYLASEVNKHLRNEPNALEEFNGKLRLKGNLHFYTSSAPCGNAVLKKFAKGGIGPKFNFASERMRPSCFCKANHSMGFTAVKEGQISPLWKRIAGDRGEVFKSLLKTDGKIHPPGTTIATSLNRDRLLTCSDRLLIWNCIGYQNEKLSGILHRVEIDTMTVGRKFSAKHCARAVCCRMQNFLPRKIDGLQEPYGVRHPILLCCSVKLDNGVYDGTDSGALFSETLCLSWSSQGLEVIENGISSMKRFEVIDGAPDEMFIAAQKCCEKALLSMM